MAREEDSDDDMVCLGESFFINDNYKLTTFTFGSQILELFCLQSASTDYDLTGQLVWPGAMLMNDYLSKNAEMLQGCSVIELGSGVGITGILCSRFCRKVVFTDHNDEVLKIVKKNIELHASSENSNDHGGLFAEKLEWGNSDQIDQILQRHTGGFDLVLGADICFQQSSIPLLFETVEKLLRIREGQCKFILAYVSRSKSMDTMVLAGLLSFCCVFWRKKKIQGQGLESFLEKRHSLRMRKKAFDKTIAELEQKAAEEACASSEVLEDLGDMVREREDIKRKPSTTYSLGRDGSRSILPIFDGKPKSHSFQKASVTLFHTLSHTSSEESSSGSVSETSSRIPT